MGEEPSAVSKRHRACRLGSLAAVFLVGNVAGAQAADGPFCRDPAVNALVVAAAHDTLSPDNLAELSRRFDSARAATLPDCDTSVAYCLGLKVALGSVDRAYVLLGQAEPDLAGARAILTEGRRQGSPWQLLVALGDVTAALAHQTSDPALYHNAASDLQFALNAINEPPLCGAFGEIRPGPEDIRRIRKRAQEAVMLSPRFDIARTKSGDCGGIFLDKMRGLDVESVPVPITFAYDAAAFTAEGEKAADALLQCLREKNLPLIVLTGHTDARGSDAYNMDLSARRLATVQAYLKTGGYAGALRLIPMGKREPFQPDDLTQHSPDEIDQMNRRVELRETAP